MAHSHVAMAALLLTGCPVPKDEERADTASTPVEPADSPRDTRTMGLHEVATKIIADSPADSAGRSVAGPGDMNGDGLPDLLIGAPQDDDGGSEAGAAYVVLSPVVAGMTLDEAAGKLIGDLRASWTGWAVAGAGDVDTDGYADILVGAIYSDLAAPENPGRAYLMLGPASGDIDLSDADVSLVGSSDDDQLGRSVAGAGDQDGDGRADLLVGAPAEDPGMTDAGIAYLVPGDARGSFDLSGSIATLTGEDRYDYAGYDVAGAGDVDGDGAEDLLLGAYYADGSRAQSGVVYLQLGPVAGTLALADADARLLGESACAGGAVAAAGDVDADGLPDLLVGAHLHNEGGLTGGAAYVVAGATRGTVSLGDATARLIGEDGGDDAGYSVDGAGDVDADGFSDVLVGAVTRAETGYNAGAAYLVRGPVSGTLSLSNADLRLLGEGASDGAGRSVAGPGDTDGDGLADLVVGANSAGADAGAVYLVRPRGF